MQKVNLFSSSTDISRLGAVMKANCLTGSLWSLTFIQNMLATTIVLFDICSYIVLIEHPNNLLSFYINDISKDNQV